MGTTSHGFCVQWSLQEGCFVVWHKPRHVSTNTSFLSPAYSSFVVQAMEALCLFSHCVHEHSWLWTELFYVKHKHLGFKECCVLSGSTGPSHSEQRQPWTTACQTTAFQNSCSQRFSTDSKMVERVTYRFLFCLPTVTELQDKLEHKLESF